MVTSLDILKQMALDQMAAKHPNIPRNYLVIPKYTDRTANGLTRCIIDFIRLDGYQAERINTMGRTIDNRKRVTDVLGRTKLIGSTTYIPTTGTKGSADIHSIIKSKSGIVIPWKIEVKIGRDRMSSEQYEYKHAVEKAGGQYSTVKSFEDFYTQYLELISK